MNGPTGDARGLGRILARNIEALLEVRAEAERRRTRAERVADAITSFTGSMPFVWLHVVIYGAWLVINAGVFRPLVRPWDPFPFVMLAMIASVEAIFLSTFILISQNRMQKLAEQRAQLDLQINLLAEREVTRLLALTDAIATKLGVPAPDGSDVEALKADVAPEEVLHEMERIEQAHEQSGPGAARPSAVRRKFRR